MTGKDDSEMAGFVTDRDERLRAAAEAIVRHSRARGTARLVLWALAVLAADAGGDWCVSPGNTHISRYAGCSPASVLTGLRSLSALGEVRRVEVERRHKNLPYTWQLTLPGLGNTPRERTDDD